MPVWPVGILVQMSHSYNMVWIPRRNPGVSALLLTAPVPVKVSLPQRSECKKQTILKSPNKNIASK